MSDSVRSHMSPVRRLELAHACFEAVLAEDATLTAESKLRLVRFSLDAGAKLPVDWYWQAMRAMRRSGDLEYTLRLAHMAMSHDLV